MFCAKSDWNWPSGSGEEDENVKRLQQRQQRWRTTEKLWPEMLIWAYGSGELKSWVAKYRYIIYFLFIINMYFQLEFYICRQICQGDLRLFSYLKRTAIIVTTISIIITVEMPISKKVENANPKTSGNWDFTKMVPWQEWNDENNRYT